MKKQKYKEIEETIKDKIRTKEYKPGYKLPTEESLCRQFNTSRITVRKALNNLAIEGLIIKRVGDGTYISEPNIVNGDGRTRSFSQDMISNGKIPGSETIVFKIIKANSEEYIKQILQLLDSDHVFLMVKIRTGDGVPIALSRTYVPVNLVPAEDIEKIKNESLYAYMDNKYGIDFDATNWRTISAVMPTRSQKKLLKISDEPLLKISHPSTIKNGKVFEYSETYYVGSRFVYKTNR